MHKNHKILHSTYLTQSPYFTARKDAYQLASGKIVDPYYVVEIPDSVICMGITEEQKIVLVKQYRHPIQQESLELPGGFVDAGEDKQLAAAREMEEETGYRFTEFYNLGKTSANPGLISNFTYLFLAVGGKKSGRQNWDENEEIEVLTVTIPEVQKWIAESAFIQSLHEVCLHRGLARYQNLNL